MKRLEAFGKAACIANAALVVVILVFYSLEDFLMGVMGLYGARLQMWFDVCCNSILFAVLLAVVLWIALFEKER
jgi:membrane-anchored glycerophosphoryl diester phosphodiesterase (GDPDase)